MLSTENTCTLVTGASGGLGGELAKIFALHGHRLLLSGRNEGALKKLSESLGGAPRVEMIAQDLSKEGAAAELYEETRRRGLRVDILVNNAGFGNYGLFSDSDLKKDKELLGVNVVAVVELTKFFLQPMLKARSGRILNVASTAAFQPGPGMAMYYASKAFILSFSLALSQELKGSGVTVSALCPGPTDTGFQESAGLSRTKLMRVNRMSAARVAQDGYSALMKKRRLLISGTANRIAAKTVPFVPRSLVLNLVEWLHR